MKNMFNLKRRKGLLLLPLFLGTCLPGANAQLPSFTHTYVANNGMVRVDQNNSNMIITPYYGSNNNKEGYLMASNVESGGVLSVKLTAMHPVDGLQLWSKEYKGYNSTYGNTRCFAITPDRNDNGYVLTGYRNNPDTKRDELWLMKVDADGNYVYDYSFSSDNIPCSTDGPLEQPCDVFEAPSFYGLDILQIHSDPDSLKNGDFLVTGFLSSKPSVNEYGTVKRSFVWRFRFSRLSPSNTPGILTRYLKVFHSNVNRGTIDPTSEDFTYEVQEIPKYGLMLVGHVPPSPRIPLPTQPRRPYFALLNYNGGGASNISSTVFQYASYTQSSAIKNVRALYGKDDVIYMLGYYFPTRSFTITPIKPGSGGTGLTRIYFSPDAADMPAFSMYQSRNNSSELVVMGYRLGINEPTVRTDFVHPFTIKIGKDGRILTKFSLEAIRSSQYNAYTPGDPGGTDYFRPFEKGFPIATVPEIGLVNNHINYNDATVAGVLYRGFTSGIERFHATASQFQNLNDDAECHPYRLSPDQDSVQLVYNPATFIINSIQFQATPYLTVVSEANSEYGCRQIPQQRPDPTAGPGTIAAENKTFTVYPNPAQEQVTIRYNGDNQEAQLTVQDITGRVLFSDAKAVLGQQPYTINLSRFVPGVYMIYVNDATGGSQRFRFVKE